MLLGGVIQLFGFLLEHVSKCPVYKILRRLSG